MASAAAATDGTVPSGPTFGRAPNALPLVGHAWALWRRPLEFLESLSTYGDLVEIKMPRNRIFVICHPDLAREVLTDLKRFDRTGMVFDMVRKSLGSGLAMTAHADHRRQRLIVQPAFHHSKLPIYGELIQEEIASTMQRWRSGEVVDLVQEMFRLTNTISMRAFFSTNLDAAEARELHETFDVYLHAIYKKAMLSMVAGVQSLANRRFDKAVDAWRGMVKQLIEERRRTDGEHDDLLARLLLAHGDEQRTLSDEEISDQVALLLLAGSETTSASVFWALHLLITHPIAWEAVRLETDQVLGGKPAGWEHLARLQVTSRALREAMRLYPPTWVLHRTSTQETTLAGQTVPAGSMVLFSPLILHRRADFFPSPHSFDPDRWLPDNKGSVPHRMSYVPFGAGATKCVGEDFGTMEATLLLASVVNQWNLTALDGPDVHLGVRSVLAPTSYQVKLARREQTPKHRP